MRSGGNTGENPRNGRIENSKGKEGQLLRHNMVNDGGCGPFWFVFLFFGNNNVVVDLW